MCIIVTPVTSSGHCHASESVVIIVAECCDARRGVNLVNPVAGVEVVNVTVVLRDILILVVSGHGKVVPGGGGGNPGPDGDILLGVEADKHGIDGALVAVAAVSRLRPLSGMGMRPSPVHRLGAVRGLEAAGGRGERGPRRRPCPRR